jgi:serine/threonine-protein kinase
MAARTSSPTLDDCLSELTTVRRRPAIDRYRIVRLIGRGGMALVYEAYDRHYHRRVALKRLRPSALRSAMAVPRILREVAAASRLTSKHAVRVHGVERGDDGAPFITMELLDGYDLAQLGPRTLSPAEAVDLILQVLDAVAEAHALGIVHRDLKPHNMFVTRGPDGGRSMKVLDFGIAKAPWTDGHATRTHDIVGSPAYMAPEQARATRDVDARADIWSIGVCLYELLTGVSPFVAPSVAEIFSNILFVEPRPLHGIRRQVPVGLSAVVLRCLSKDPAARWPDARTLAEALAPFGTAAPVLKPRRRPYWVLFVLLAFAVGFVAMKRHHVPPVKASAPAVMNVHDLPDAHE